ncbi:hypothetical protein OS493_038121, partial [Desmophyllum pertusum]
EKVLDPSGKGLSKVPEAVTIMTKVDEVQVHVDLDKEIGASKFTRSFNLTSTLTLLTRKTFEDSNSYEIVEKGFKT